MTSIIAFRFNSGENWAVVSDRQVTYSASLSGRNKIRFNNRGDFLIAGSGSYEIIEDVISHIRTKRTLNTISKGIREKLNQVMDHRSRCFGEAIGTTLEISFIVSNGREGKYISVYDTSPHDLRSIELLGSSREWIGQVEQNLGGIANLKYNEDRRDMLIKKMIEIFDDLARSDPYTGHPRVFGLDMYLYVDEKWSHIEIIPKKGLQIGDIYEVEERDI